MPFSLHDRPAGRLRCCGKFCFWRAPLGPWCCTSCDRTFEGPMPKSAEARFWDYVDGVISWLDRRPAAVRALEQRLLGLFFRRKGGF
jgi:hypothetical protein